MNQITERGMCPKEGRLERSHPSTSPEIMAPPLVLSDMGMFPHLITMAPIIQPTAIPRPMNTISLSEV